MAVTVTETDASKEQLSDDKMRAEIAKLAAETSKINTENRLYPWIASGAGTLAIVVIAKLLL